MSPLELPKAIALLKKEYAKWRAPIVTQYADQKRDPFKILVSTVISLRTKDQVTAEATGRLWDLAGTPQAMSRLSEKSIAKAIYPAGFYQVKAKNIKGLCSEILRKYNGKVPSEIDELTQFTGVGRKTANLVVTKGFGKPGICVDTHVHRICNRWGYVSTKTPDQTEQSLRRKLPKRYWIIINDLLVSYGQHSCTPVSPFCSKCTIRSYCRRKGVKSAR